MTRTNARLLSTLALVLTLAVTQQDYGQVDSIMDKQYEWCGISVKVPDGFRAEEADMIWKPNKTFEHKHSGRFINVMAKSDDGNCVLLYTKALHRLIKKGKEDRMDGQMALISREMMEGMGILDESGMTTLENSDSNDLFYTEEHITRITGESVRKMTGADLVCFYDLPVENSEFTKESSKLDGFQPKTLTRIHIIKEGGAHYDIIMLLNESGPKRRCLRNIRHPRHTEEVLGTRPPRSCEDSSEYGPETKSWTPHRSTERHSYSTLSSISGSRSRKHPEASQR